MKKLLSILILSLPILATLYYSWPKYFDEGLIGSVIIMAVYLVITACIAPDVGADNMIFKTIRFIAITLMLVIWVFILCTSIHGIVIIIGICLGFALIFWSIYQWLETD
jgi:hypothetical protein